MKNSKKFLVIFCAITVLFATVFSMVSVALVAGEGTSVDEYVYMKISATEEFEEGGTGIAGPIRNGSSSNGGIFETNNVRIAKSPIYGNTNVRSVYYYAIDYDTNYNSRRHLYIQPTLGDLNTAEKTPENGFVSEFDIAFFSPSYIEQKQVVDENGNPVWKTQKDSNGVLNIVYDEAGNPVPENEDVMVPLYAPRVDKDGNVVYQLAYEIEKDEQGNDKYQVKTDADGNVIYQIAKDRNGNVIYQTEKDASGEIKLDENGAPVYVTDENGYKLYEYVYDETGNRVPEYVYDDMGEKIPVYKYENGEKVPVYTTNENGEIIQAYKTDFYGDPVPEYDPVLNENGEPVLVCKAIRSDFVGINTTFDVQMLNTVTMDDGVVDLISFTTNAEDRTVSIKVAGAIKYTFRADTWCHITVQYDAKTLLTNVYAGDDDTEGGRKLIVTKNTVVAIVNRGGAEGNVYPLSFRLGSTSGTGVVGFDNFIAYQGSTVHDPTRVNLLPAYKKFIFMTDILNSVKSDENNEDAENVKYETAVNRFQAYQFLTNDEEMKLVFGGSYYGHDKDGNEIKATKVTADEKTALANAMAVLNRYMDDEEDETTEGVYDALIEAAKTENVITYYNYANDAYTMTRMLDNVTDREKRVSMAEEFYSGVNSLIDRDSSLYNEAVERLQAAKSSIESDRASGEFVTLMRIFDNSVAYGASINRLKAHYENAKMRYPEITKDIDGLEKSSAENLRAAISSYLAAESIIFDENLSVNAGRFVSIISLMKQTSSGKWENDGETVENLWYKALNIIIEGEYDPAYPGFASAKAVFDEANVHFWKNMQDEHVAIIRAKLDTYNEKDKTYIDRAGICTYVDRYLDINKQYIDYNYVDLNKEISRNEAFKAQLATLEGDYEKILIQNTTKFINVMKDMAQYDTYEALKPLFDQATTYYYAMNIEDGMNEYLEHYEDVRNLLDRIESDTQTYVDIVNGTLTDLEGNAIYGNLASLTDRSEIYKSLVGCYLCEENFDITYPGAREAKAVYESKYQEYTGAAKLANERIENSKSVVFAVRGNWDFDNIVAFVKNLFN